MKSPAKRILLIDDHPIMRHGLAQLIGAEADLKVCGEAGSAVAGLEAISKCQPDLVVVDLASLLAGSDLEHNAPGSPVLCMSDPEDLDCAPIFQNLGLPFGQRPGGVQTFLRAERAAHKEP